MNSINSSLGLLAPLMTIDPGPFLQNYVLALGLLALPQLRMIGS